MGLISHSPTGADPFRRSSFGLDPLIAPPLASASCTVPAIKLILVKTQSVCTKPGGHFTPPSAGGHRRGTTAIGRPLQPHKAVPRGARASVHGGGGAGGDVRPVDAPTMPPPPPQLRSPVAGTRPAVAEAASSNSMIEWPRGPPGLCSVPCFLQCATAIRSPMRCSGRPSSLLNDAFHCLPPLLQCLPYSFGGAAREHTPFVILTVGLYENCLIHKFRDV